MKLEHMLRRLLFPSRCMLCGMVLEGDRQLCPACMERAVLQSGPARHGPEEHYDGAAAALRYEGAVRQAIHGLKYREKQSYARPLARIMKEIALRQLREDFDLITFVPSNPGTERKRGYNQSRLLAEELALRDLDGQPLTRENYDALMARIDAYLSEFDEHGTDRVTVDLDEG